MNHKKIVTWAVVAVIAAIAIYWYLKPSNKVIAPEQTQNSQGSNNLNSDAITGTATNSLPPTKNSILVSTQIAGTTVTIDNIYLENSGFIVIHEDNNGTAGAIIGSSGLVNSGVGQDLEVKATLKAGGTYFAMLHKDDGDKIFNSKLDSPLLNEKSDPIMVKFQVGN